MTDPIAAARDVAKRFIADVQDGVLPLGKEAENILTEAILAAGFCFVTPPDKDVMEGALDIVIEYQLDQERGRANRLKEAIVAFATACVAREMDACAQWHDAQAAENQRIAEIHRESGNWDLRVTFERIANTHRNSAAAIRARSAP